MSARDFDQQRLERRHSWSQEARTFVLGGHTFVGRASVRPEVLAEYHDRVQADEAGLSHVIAATDDALLAMIEGGNDVQEQPGPPVPDPLNEGALVPGPPVLVPIPDSPRARYLALRARTDDPIDLDILAEIVKWLVEVQGGRPTQPSADSLNGHASTGTSSTDTSSPPPVLAPTA